MVDVLVGKYFIINGEGFEYYKLGRFVDTLGPDHYYVEFDAKDDIPMTKGVIARCEMSLSDPMSIGDCTWWEFFDSFKERNAYLLAMGEGAEKKSKIATLVNLDDHKKH